MERDEFLGKLYLCYFGDNNARDEIISVYDNLILSNKKRKEVIDKINKYIEQHSNKETEYLDIWEVKELLDILKEVK